MGINCVAAIGTIQPQIKAAASLDDVGLMASTYSGFTEFNVCSNRTDEPNPATMSAVTVQGVTIKRDGWTALKIPGFMVLQDGVDCTYETIVAYSGAQDGYTVLKKPILAHDVATSTNSAHFAATKLALNRPLGKMIE